MVDIRNLKEPLAAVRLGRTIRTTAVGERIHVICQPPQAQLLGIVARYHGAEIVECAEAQDSSEYVLCRGMAGQNAAAGTGAVASSPSSTARDVWGGADPI
ncbi:MAG TPA: hypothetical protein VEA40_03200 [Ramlibacter sp.]|nr:hypothetical protein [Ramlibacter sp.]